MLKICIPYIFLQYKKYYQKRKYRINPICPNCREERCCWTITLSDEEQETLDNYYKAHEKDLQGNPHLFNLMYDIENKPLVIKRVLQCSQCNEEFEAMVTVSQEDELGYRHKNMIPMHIYPVD
ncbi:MAG: hypothetical protein II567_16950 [Candidatus Riflebacteria bacterium]|nr:hypothetical protein [Candidatus Riflebacteria bacterium]